MFVSDSVYFCECLSEPSTRSWEFGDIFELQLSAFEQNPTLLKRRLVHNHHRKGLIFSHEYNFTSTIHMYSIVNNLTYNVNVFSSLKNDL